MSAHHGTSGKRGSGSPYESDAEPRYDVQTWRKIAYYAGAALTLLGFVLFFVPFLSVFSFFDGLSSGSGGSEPRICPLAGRRLAAIRRRTLRPRTRSRTWHPRSRDTRRRCNGP